MLCGLGNTSAPHGAPCVWDPRTAGCMLTAGPHRLIPENEEGVKLPDCFKEHGVEQKKDGRYNKGSTRKREKKSFGRMREKHPFSWPPGWSNNML